MTKVKLGEVAFEGKSSYKGAKNGIPIVGLEHLESEKITLDTWDVDTDNTFTKCFEPGDVLFGRRRAYLKKAAVAKVSGICSGDITVIRSLKDKFNPRLLPFVIQNDAFFDYAVSKSAGSLSPRVKWEHIKEYEFELPVIQRQEDLANMLWSIQDAIKAYKNLLCKTDELVKSQFMEQFLSSEARSRLGDFITQVRGVSYKPADLHLSLDNESVLLLRANNISNGLVNHDDVQYVAVNKVSAVQRIIPGDILMCGSSGSLEHVGKTAFCTDNVAGETFGAFCKIIRCKDGLNPEFLSAYFRTGEYREVIMQLANGSNINNLKNEHIDELMVPIPSISSQAGFVAFVRQSDKSKFELEKTISELNSLYKKIISENLG